MRLKKALIGAMTGVMVGLSLLGASMPAMAAESDPKPSTGSRPDDFTDDQLMLTVTTTFTEGTFTIYKIADIDYVTDDGWGFVLTENYKGSGILPDQGTVKTLGAADYLANDYVNNRQAAAAFEKIAKAADIVGTFTLPAEVKVKGKRGLFLVTYKDDNTENGENKINPALIAVPNYNGKEYINVVEARPKPEEIPAPTPEPTPTPTTTPPPYIPYDPPVTPPTPPTPPSQQTVLGAVREVIPPAPPQVLGAQRLPKTGQLWWPVPILAAAGCAMVVLGGIRRKNAAK